MEPLGAFPAGTCLTAGWLGRVDSDLRLRRCPSRRKPACEVFQVA